MAANTINPEGFQKLFSSFPIGPELRRVLKLETPEELETPTADEWRSFELQLKSALNASDISSVDELASILEELVLTKLPLATLSFAESANVDLLRSDFRCALSVGAAALMAGEFTVAEDFLRLAQSLVPEEIAPYTNMCELLYRGERDQECLDWAILGLAVAPNSRRLWEFVGAVRIQLGDENTGEFLRQLADKHNSWAGRSLAAQYIDQNDTLLRAQLLEDLYSQGMRDEEFLIEYTAALGVALQYDKIPAIVWDAEQGKKTKQLPWQLYAHAAQAHSALSQDEQALKLLEKSLKQNIESEEVIKELTDLRTELLETLANKTIH